MKVIAYIINIIFLLSQILILFFKIIDYGSLNLLEAVNPIKTVIYLVISVSSHYPYQQIERMVDKDQSIFISNILPDYSSVGNSSVMICPDEVQAWKRQLCQVLPKCCNHLIKLKCKFCVLGMQP